MRSTCPCLIALTVATALAPATGLVGQTLLRDINTTPAVNPNSDLHDMLTIGTTTFLGITTTQKSQLWTTDGAGAGTTLIREMATIATPGPVAYFCNVGGVLFFAAPDSRFGEELWRSDGTEAGTVLVRDITPGGAGSGLQGLTEINGLVVFGTARGVYGFGSLWRSDGTGAGTFQLTPTPPVASLSPKVVGRSGNALLFTCTNAANGEELWTTDGSTAGTGLLKDCRPGPAGSSPADFYRLGNSMVFTADIGAASRETWITDGTGPGTRPVREVFPAFDRALPSSFVDFGSDKLFLTVTAAGTHALWRGDGSAPGTALVRDLSGISYYAQIHVLGTRAVFEGSGPNDGHEIWVTDGTTSGTHLVDVKPGGGGSEPGNFFVNGGYLYFSADASVLGRELYRSDGTVAGTGLVADINPGIYAGEIGSWPSAFFEVQGRLLFTANDGLHGSELWRTDGTAAGTALVRDINANGNADPDRAVFLNGIALFTAFDDTHGRELWRTDGTSAGTWLVADLNSGGSTAGSQAARLVDFGGDLMFSVSQPGVGLWRSDGTAVGTAQVGAGFLAGSDRIVVNGMLFSVNQANSNGAVFVSDGTAAGTQVLVDPQNFALSSRAVLLGALGNEVLFFNFVGTPNVGLWRSDGTAQGTLPLVAGLEPPDQGSTATNRRWAALGGLGYFSGRDRNAQFGFELWRTDGTAAGTQMVQDINPGVANSQPGVFSVVNGALVFCADHVAYGREPWRSNGTASGTSLIVDLNPGPASGVSGLWPRSSLQGDTFMLFPGNDGVRGLELYRTDGTTAGTSLVRDLVPGSGTAFANQSTTAGRWVVSGNLLYFPADDGQIGMELWVSDGTMAATRLVRDLQPDEAGSFPSMLTPMDSTGRLLFAASGPGVATELWQTDGTAVGTQLVADMTPGARNTTFGESLRIGSAIYFTADDGTYGREIWRLSVVDMQGTVVERFGQGCAGNLARIPELVGIGLPRLGESGFGLGLENGVTQAYALLQLGWSWTIRPISTGCIWFPIHPVANLIACTDTSGAAMWSLPLPRSPGLIGLELVGQTAMFDGVSIPTSNAVYLLVGR